MNLSKVFDAMPHVVEVWLTPDGHFHLHNNNGGERITRNRALSASVENTDITENKPVVDNQKFNKKR